MHLLYALVRKSSFSKAQGFIKPAPGSLAVRAGVMSWLSLAVGAGAAGNVLAARLSGAPGGATVLLLEAGGDDVARPAVHMPIATDRLTDSDFDYKYLTVPQKRACRNMQNCVCDACCIVSCFQANFMFPNAEHLVSRYEMHESCFL